MSGWEVIDDISRIDRDEWNSVVERSGGSVFHTHEWLTSYEKAPPAPLHHVRHLLFRRGRELRAVAPLYEASEDPHYTGYGSDYGFDHPILRARMLVGHSWYSYFNGICSLDPAAVVAPGLLDALREVSEELGSPLYGFPGVPETDALCAELAAHRFTPVYTEATSGVDFANSVEEHLATLRPKVRREFLRLARRSTKLGADVRHDLDDDTLAAFAVLVETVCARHGVPSINPPASLRSIERELGRHVHIIGLWRDGALLGGFLLLHHCDVLYAWIAGLDYEYHKEFGTYYRLYVETLALAERLGVRRIEMGRSMYGFKVRMGFRPQLLVSWFRSTGPHGAQLLRTGLPILDEACRTRDRVAAAYRDAGVPVPSELLAPALFRPVVGATGTTATASPASARSPAQ